MAHIEFKEEEQDFNKVIEEHKDIIICNLRCNKCGKDFGDVIFSPEAIKKIVNTDTDDVMFFGSAPPYAPEYVKQYAEPFAFKVVNQDHFKSAIRLTELFYKQGMFKRKPIAWELWQVITNHKLNHIDYNSYVHINDYTCDVDEKADLIMIESMMED